MKNFFHIVASLETQPRGCCSEFDLHVDTCVGRSNCLLLEHDGHTINVSPYSGEYDSQKDIPIALVATLWIEPKNGAHYILIIHEALYFGDKVKGLLLNPNQLQAHGLIVEDVPWQFSSKSSHSILSPKDNMEVPLSLTGIMSSFESIKPIWEDYNLLLPNVPWKPNSEEFAKKEAKLAKVAAITVETVDKDEDLFKD